MPTPSRTRFIPIGLMLFALFFGAGNLIFPASMGQAAGTEVWWALLGFCITGVGLPLLTVIDNPDFIGVGNLGALTGMVGMPLHPAEYPTDAGDGGNHIPQHPLLANPHLYR